MAFTKHERTTLAAEALELAGKLNAIAAIAEEGAVALVALRIAAFKAASDKFTTAAIRDVQD